MLIKARNFIFQVDFTVFDIRKNQDLLMILGRPFLANGQALLDFETCEMI